MLSLKKYISFLWDDCQWEKLLHMAEKWATGRGTLFYPLVRPRQRERATRHAAPCSSRTDSAPEALLCVAAVAAPLSCFIHDVNILFSASVLPSRRNQSSSARSVRPQIGSLFLRRQSDRVCQPLPPRRAICPPLPFYCSALARPTLDLNYEP